jgi:hypothetical protein
VVSYKLSSNARTLSDQWLTRRTRPVRQGRDLRSRNHLPVRVDGERSWSALSSEGYKGSPERKERCGTVPVTARGLPRRGARGRAGRDFDQGAAYPDYDTLAAMLRKNPETIVEAMKRLIQHGFVTKHRRSKLVGTPQGERRVQDSNAYEVHMPDAGLAVVPLVADRTSGSDNPGVSVLQDPDRHENLSRRSKEERFWLAEPWRMADGSIY